MGRSNITLSLDDLALEAGKAYAAKRGLTLNKAVNQLFLSLASEGDLRVPITTTERALYRYAGGRASLSETVEALGVNDGGVVLRLLREMGLPAPVLDEAVARQQAAAALPSLQAAMKPSSSTVDVTAGRRRKGRSNPG